jgi:hypothetical protein
VTDQENFGTFNYYSSIKSWRKLHKEEIRDLNSPPSIIRIIKLRIMRWAGHVARMGEKRNMYRLLVGKPQGMRPLRRPRCGWVDKIKIDLVESFRWFVLNRSGFG